MIAIVAPVVVAALGAVAPRHTQWQVQIPGKVHVDASEKYALLGTGKMLRFLNLSGSW